MNLSQLNNLQNNLFTDVELLENTLENRSDEDHSYMRTFDHETVSTIREYLETRLEYRTIALISLDKSYAFH